jgi:type IV pilus assembly protein PilM
MFNFFNPKICSFGIDLSDLSIKIIDLKKERGIFSLASFGRQEIPPGLIEEGEIKKEGELIEVIKKAIKGVRGKSLKSGFCVASLPETESFVRVVKLPIITKEEVSEAIKWEIEANIPLSLDEIYYDWQIIETDPNSLFIKDQEHLNVLVGVLPKKTVDPYLDVLKKAGLRPCVFEIESIAATRALIKEGEDKKSLVIVDMGAKRTSLAISSNQTVYFTTSLNISNNSLVEVLSESLKISKDRALQIKLKVGLGLKHPESRVFQILKEPLQEMAAKIKNYIDFYQEHIGKAQFAGKKIEQILLCGGGANLDGLPEFLTSELKIDVSVGNPLVNISKNINEELVSSLKDPLAYTTALGLALRSHD